jgi:DNA-binding LacI/PurR family transcriptional regulator
VLSTREFRRPFAARDDVKEVFANRRALGYIVWSAGIFPERIDPLLALLERSGKPVAVLDETGIARRTTARPEAMRFYVYGYGPTPGLTVGRHLAGLRHRYVLYLSPYHDSEWSRTRLEALRLALSRAGHPRAVAATTDDRPSPMEIADESVREEAKLLDDVLAEAATRPRASTAAATAVLREMTLRKIEALWAEAIRIRVEGLVSQALVRRDYTAIACANDTTAVHCLRALRSAGVRVPGDVSVIGFDDSVEALSSGLTSYNFNGHAVMSAMVDHVLHPVRRRQRQEPIVEIEGYVHQRGTVASAGQRGSDHTDFP